MHRPNLLVGLSNAINEVINKTLGVIGRLLYLDDTIVFDSGSSAHVGTTRAFFERLHTK